MEPTEVFGAVEHVCDIMTCSLNLALLDAGCLYYFQLDGSVYALSMSKSPTNLSRTETPTFDSAKLDHFRP